MSRTVAIVIPTLNEEARIGGLLAQVSRLPGDLVVDIMVADGRSTDRTRALVEEAARMDPRVRLIDNPARLQAAGVNRAVAVADPRADTIVRIDAHAFYPDDYVPCIVAAFAQTGADMVAIRLNTQGQTCLQRGIAAAQNSKVGSGGSAHRVGGYRGFVDHGHHAGMDRAMFVSVGGYDERFAANEDAELDSRIRRAGGRIWLAGDIEALYFPRRTLSALWRQYRRYGQGRARTFLKHRERLRARQMLPPLLPIAILGSLLLAPVLPWLLAVPALYAALLVGTAFALVRQTGRSCALFAAPATATMHLAWGIGFLACVLDRTERRRFSLSQPKPSECVSARQPIYSGGEI